MNRVISTTLLLVLTLQLSACGSSDQATEEIVDTQPTISIDEYRYIDGIYGAKAGLYITRLLSQPIGYTSQSKPSAALGVFISSYIAQGTFSEVLSAIAGINAQIKLIAGQQEVVTEEVFTLMTQYGALLQVNVPDMLNRSTDREEALDTYTETLKNFTELMQRKEAEMKATEDELEDLRRTERKAVQTSERAIRQAFNNQEFEAAARQQEELAQLKAALTKTETRLDQIGDMRKRFKDVLKIGTKRIGAIEANRRIILSGLTVVDVPGIEEFNLIQD